MRSSSAHLFPAGIGTRPAVAGILSAALSVPDAHKRDCRQGSRFRGAGRYAAATISSLNDAEEGVGALFSNTTAQRLGPGSRRRADAPRAGDQLPETTAARILKIASRYRRHGPGDVRQQLRQLVLLQARGLPRRSKRECKEENSHSNLTAQAIGPLGACLCWEKLKSSGNCLPSIRTLVLAHNKGELNEHQHARPLHGAAQHVGKWWFALFEFRPELCPAWLEGSSC